MHAKEIQEVKTWVLNEKIINLCWIFSILPAVFSHSFCFSSFSILFQIYPLSFFFFKCQKQNELMYVKWLGNLYWVLLFHKIYSNIQESSGANDAIKYIITIRTFQWSPYPLFGISLCFLLWNMFLCFISPISIRNWILDCETESYPRHVMGVWSGTVLKVVLSLIFIFIFILCYPYSARVWHAGPHPPKVPLSSYQVDWWFQFWAPPPFCQ